MEIIIGAGLLLTGLGVALNKKNEDINLSHQNDKARSTQLFPKNYYDNYKSKIYQDSNEFLYENISNLYKKSSVPDSKIVNNIYRIINDPYDKEKKKEFDDLLYKDINMKKEVFKERSSLRIISYII